MKKLFLPAADALRGFKRAETSVATAAIVAAIFLFAGCGAGEPERFVPPEDESIYVSTGATVRETGLDSTDTTGSEPGDAETWLEMIYMSPNAHTMYSVLGVNAGSSFLSPDHDPAKLSELLEGLIFDSAGMPFSDPLIRLEDARGRGAVPGLRRDSSNIYMFNPDEHYLFDENGREIGIIRIRHEGDPFFQHSAPAGVEILTVEEFEAQEGFFTFEEAAYVLGAEFRLPAEHMDAYEAPLFSGTMWWDIRKGLIVVYELTEPTEIFTGMGTFFIFIEPLGDYDIEYIVEMRSIYSSVEQRGVGSTAVYRLYHPESKGSDFFMWEHDGLIYSLTAPTGFCPEEGMYDIFEEQEIFELIASMIW
ncbi:MAG: hypothetical protein FWC70_09885 [Defluviitaleaceae bacterium]|nr:hypothetical protein [Defluviitaleaceae bacterium]